MNHLLWFEFYKLLHQKSTKVCGILLICLSLLSLATTKSLWDGSSADALGAAMPTASSLAVSTLSSCSFSLILAIFTALFVAEDSSEGTIKNIYARGYKRTEVFLAKLIAASVYCLVMAALCIAIALVGGMVLFPTDSALEVSTLIPLVPQLILMLAYTFLYGLIASVTKKSGGAIVGCVVAPMLVALVLGMIDTLLRLDRFQFSVYWLDNLYAAVNTATATRSKHIHRYHRRPALYGGAVLCGRVCQPQKSGVTKKHRSPRGERRKSMMRTTVSRVVQCLNFGGYALRSRLRFKKGCLFVAPLAIPSKLEIQKVRKTAGSLSKTGCFMVAGTGFEPATSGL